MPYGDPVNVGLVCHCTLGGLSGCCQNRKSDYLGNTWTDTSTRPNIYSQPLPPWPTLEEIRKVIRDELRKAGVV